MRIGLKTLDTKQHILDEAGFDYNFDRRVYFNRKSKKIFSVAFLEDKSEKEIKRLICDETGDKEWKFYFTGEPPESVRREVEASIGRG
jgi:hypothetical protein